MLEADAKRDLNLLTPNIRLIYTDFTQITTGILEKTGYFVYEAKSRINGQVHHIRAFNLNAPDAKKNIDKAITVFLQETLRLCQINPYHIVLDTLEFYENKICYAIRPKEITSVVVRTSKLNIFRLLEGLIEDLQHLSRHGNVHPSAERIYCTTNLLNLYSTYPYNSKSDFYQQYIMQDWNQILWTSINMEKLPENQDTSSQFTATKEKENIYHLALSILDIGGKKQEFQALSSIPGSNIRSMLEGLEIDVLNLNSETKDLLVAMLDQEANNRPNLKQIFRRIEEIKREIENSKMKEKRPESAVIKRFRDEELQKESRKFREFCRHRDAFIL